MATASGFLSSYYLAPFIVQPVQAKLNRLIRNSLLACQPIDETGELDESTSSALQSFRATYALDNPKPLMAGTERIIFPALYPRSLQIDLNPIKPAFVPKRDSYNPLPDLDPNSLTMEVLQWLVDHCDGPLSQMTAKAHIDLAKKMLGNHRAVPTNTPFLVSALLDAKAQFRTNMDHTDWLILTLATVAAEVGGSFIPTDEGVDRKSASNNTAYEDFDVYEPYDIYPPKVAEEMIAAAREKAMKRPGFHEPKRKPGAASDGNTDPGDGARFKGRGLVQLTHRENYDAADKDLKLGLLQNPEKANSIEISSKVMVWFFAKRAVFRFPKIQAALAANDTLTLREAINGHPRHAKPDYRPAGYGNFVDAYWTGKAFMRQGSALKISRLALQSGRPAMPGSW